MNEVITAKLKEIENQHEVKILYACESGSRAWGFASPDSDYDARFIYVHKKDHYLSIEEQRDVIGLPIDEVLDINGWELKKALRLFKKSNGPLYEWLQSPIVYMQDEVFANELRSLMSECFSARGVMHHYLSMAKGVFNDDLSNEQVRLKKYFYALRPILACRWIAERNQFPPMEFGKLRVLVDADLNLVIDKLLSQKSVVDEKFTIHRIESLNHFIEESIRYCEKTVPEAAIPNEGSDKLSKLFRNYIV